MNFTANAYAKINLTLDITSKRKDGYHTISSVMQTLSLHDILTINVEKRRDLKTEIAITSTMPYLPCEETNLCYKACNIFLNAFHIKGYNVNIDISKKIPISAGLGGGSSDGAETLKALNVIFDRKASDEQLAQLALSLGADVPFFLRGGCQKAEGIGEILTEIPPLSDCFVLVSKPKNSLLTSKIYQAYDEMIITEKSSFPQVSTQNFIKNSGFSRLSYVSNMLSPVSEKFCPEIALIKSHIKAFNAKCCEMTGSGASVFGIFEMQDEAEKAEKSVKNCFDLDFCGVYKPKSI